MPHPLQPDHLEEDTRALLVHGWKCRASFSGRETPAELAALQQAIEPSGGVFVVAQSLVYVDGEQDVVIGLPVASAHADAGPVEWSIDAAREVEAATEAAFPAALVAKLAPLLAAVPQGPAKWLLVPTGGLASGFVAHGELIDTPEDRDYKDTSITAGCNMSQRTHPKAVQGTRLGHANDWDIEEIDLSPTRVSALGPGRFFVIARFD